MGINISKFTTKMMPMKGNMTELNHLGYSLIAKPELFDGMMTKLFVSQHIYDTPFLNMTMGRERVISSNEWEYKVKGADTKPLTLLENIEESGKFGQPITAKFDEDFWQVGDVITPGDQFQDYQCRIMKNPYKSGNGYVYEMQLVTDDQSEAIPSDFRAAGHAWFKLFSTYEEAATRGGSMQFAGSMALRNHLGKLRKEYKITDYAAEQVLAMRMWDDMGKSYDKWIPYAEVQFNKEWKKEVERACWYNKDSKSIMGDNGRKVDSFPGIIQQVRDGGWYYPYDVLSAKGIESFIMDIYFGRTAPGSSERRVAAFTGEVGMMTFSKLMQNEYAKNGWIIANPEFNPAQKTSSKYHTNAYSYGCQFTEFKMPNGAIFTLIHNPLFDDPDYNQEKDPVSGYPKSSSMFLFMDLANGGNGASNIQMVVKKDGFKYGYVEGLVGPGGPKRGGFMAHSGEFYEMHYSKEFGVHIEDITKTGLMCMQ